MHADVVKMLGALATVPLQGLNAGQMLFGFGGLLIGTLVLAVGLWQLYRGVTVATSDPVDAARVETADEPVELEGTAEPLDGAGTFDAPVSGQEAMLCEVHVEEEVRSTGGERERHATERIARPLRVVDDTGAVALDPEGASLELGHSSYEAEFRPGDSLPTDVERRLRVLADEVEDEDAEREYDESYLGPGDDVHVYGATVHTAATTRHDISASLVDDPDSSGFTVSAGTQSSVVRERLAGAAVAVVVGGAFAAFGVAVLLGVVG